METYPNYQVFASLMENLILYTVVLIMTLLQYWFNTAEGYILYFCTSLHK